MNALAMSANDAVKAAVGRQLFTAHPGAEYLAALERARMSPLWQRAARTGAGVGIVNMLSQPVPSAVPNPLSWSGH
jgi:hypothetical protein